ncbi:MAG: hypothetical protein KAS72_03270 [Phycisphaerales bacterium]|nr:hypothetical protein [Phycisphaerales bacterium]
MRSTGGRSTGRGWAVHPYSEPPPLADLAAESGFVSSVHVASAMKVVRKRMMMMLLREVAAETASDPADQQAEYQRVVEILR